MKHLSGFPVAVVALLSLSLGLIVPHEAVATIVITGGSLEVVNGGGAVSISGDSRGFSLLGGGQVGLGLAPQGPYQAEEPIGLRAAWFGIDLGGSFTLDGTTYLMGSVAWPFDPTFRGNGWVDFEGSTTAPAFGPTTATITAPFTFSGQVRTSTGQWPNVTIETEDLTGAGTTTIDLVWSLSHQWNLANVSYDFQTPEPSTVLLFGSGLAGLGGVAWRRHRKS